MKKPLALGLDFGTESVRALLVDVSDGAELATAVAAYPHGVIEGRLPETGVALEPESALQDPQDYLDAMARAVAECLGAAGAAPESVVGIGTDFTACTVLPTTAAGTPLCFDPRFRGQPHAWVKLWKHHAAQPEAEEMNRVAAERGEAFPARYGGRISSEWLFPKVLQVLRDAPDVYREAARFIEAGDWIVWQLTGNERRSACQAGYKATWSRADGYPSPAFLSALDPRLRDIVGTKLASEVYAMGTRAGLVTAEAAQSFGLAAGTPVAVSVIDAHVAAPAAGVVNPGQLLMIMGTSLCHVAVDRQARDVAGISGVVEDGVLPGLFGYEAGQAAVGDIFTWFVRRFVAPVAGRDEAQAFAAIEEQAAALRPGESGLLALDWWNGNRTPLVDADLSGLILGLTLESTPAEVYRALIEATAFGTRLVIENFERQGVGIREAIACGGLAERNPLLMQVFADVLDRELKLARSSQACALGAAMWGAVAAGSSGGGYDSIQDAAAQMAGLRDTAYRPDSSRHAVYDTLYQEYLKLVDLFGRGGNDVMRRLKALSRSQAVSTPITD